jgi:hypothetical protein
METGPAGHRGERLHAFRLQMEAEMSRNGNAGERAKKMENPGVRGPIENAAKRYAALAEKFEVARRLLA